MPCEYVGTGEAPKGRRRMLFRVINVCRKNDRVMRISGLPWPSRRPWYLPCRRRRRRVSTLSRSSLPSSAAEAAAAKEPRSLARPLAPRTRRDVASRRVSGLSGSAAAAAASECSFVRRSWALTLKVAVATAVELLNSCRLFSRPTVSLSRFHTCCCICCSRERGGGGGGAVNIWASLPSFLPLSVAFFLPQFNLFLAVSGKSAPSRRAK